MKNIFKISCLFIATICVFALVKINPMPVYAQENALSISAIGVSSGTYATDNDSFNLPRNPDYGTFTFDDNVKEYLTDGDVTTFWENTGNFGRNPFNPDMSEYLVVDLGEIKKITGVSLMASNHGGFPEVLSCEYAVSNVDITYSVLNSTTRLEKAPETGAIQTVSFPGVVARYLYVNVQRAFKHTTYSQIHNVAIYDVCISDITLYGTTASDEEKTAALEKEQNRTITTPVIDDFIVDCSSVLDVKYSDGTFAYDPSNLLDGNLSTLWYNSFAATATEKAEEYITLQTADYSKVK